MSRTQHTRAPRQRTNPQVSPKKPDEGRRWMRRYLRRHDVQPVSTQRQTVDVQHALCDLEIAAHDPEVLLWGGSLATWSDLLRRGKELWRDVQPDPWGWFDDSYDYYPRTTSEWYEYIDGCPCCDSGCACAMRRQADDDYYRDFHDDRDDDWNYNHDSRWSDDPCDPGWVQRWLDGEVHTPYERDSYDDLWYDQYDYYWDLGDYQEDWPDLSVDYPGDLAAVRDQERRAASTRGRSRTTRRP